VKRWVFGGKSMVKMGKNQGKTWGKTWGKLLQFNGYWKDPDPLHFAKSTISMAMAIYSLKC